MLVVMNCEMCEHYIEACHLVVLHDARGSFPERRGCCKQHVKEVKPYDSCDLWQNRCVGGTVQTATSYPDGWEESK